MYRHFIPKQVVDDSINLISRQYVPLTGCYKVLQAFFNSIKFWVQKSGTIEQLIYSVRLPHGAIYGEKLVPACIPVQLEVYSYSLQL